MSARAQRLSQLLELLSRDRHPSVAQVSRTLRTPTATVRRDLDTLASEKRLIYTHGALHIAGGADAALVRSTAARDINADHTLAVFSRDEPHALAA